MSVLTVENRSRESNESPPSASASSIRSDLSDNDDDSMSSLFCKIEVKSFICENFDHSSFLGCLCGISLLNEMKKFINFSCAADPENMQAVAK